MENETPTYNEFLGIAKYWLEEAANYTSCEETAELLKRRASQVGQWIDLVTQEQPQ